MKKKMKRKKKKKKKKYYALHTSSEAESTPKSPVVTVPAGISAAVGAAEFLLRSGRFLLFFSFFSPSPPSLSSSVLVGRTRDGQPLVAFSVEPRRGRKGRRARTRQQSKCGWLCTRAHTHTHTHTHLRALRFHRGRHSGEHTETMSSYIPSRVLHIHSSVLRVKKHL